MNLASHAQMGHPTLKKEYEKEMKEKAHKEHEENLVVKLEVQNEILRKKAQAERCRADHIEQTSQKKIEELENQSRPGRSVRRYHPETDSYTMERMDYEAKRAQERYEYEQRIYAMRHGYR